MAWKENSKAAPFDKARRDAAPKVLSSLFPTRQTAFRNQKRLRINLCLRLALRRSRTRNSVKHFFTKTQFLAGNYNKRLIFKYLVSMHRKPAICASNV